LKGRLERGCNRIIAVRKATMMPSHARERAVGEDSVIRRVFGAEKRERERERERESR